MLCERVAYAGRGKDEKRMGKVYSAERTWGNQLPTKDIKREYRKKNNRRMRKKIEGQRNLKRRTSGAVKVTRRKRFILERRRKRKKRSLQKQNNLVQYQEKRIHLTLGGRGGRLGSQ